MANPSNQGTECFCVLCQHKLDFDIDDHLLDEIEADNCFVFAGAGISTETANCHADSLYDELRSLAMLEDSPSFPSVVDEVEKLPNGRQKFLEAVRNRFAYIDGFSCLRDIATQFHVTLSAAPYFGPIVTTNWDRYFEDVMGRTPFVYDQDIALWSTAKKPVLKIHGSIDNLSSLVASSSDYIECEERLKSGRLGDLLRHLFSTRTCVFFGYSAKDDDFLSIYRSVTKSLGRLSRRHYLVSPFITEDQATWLRNELNIVAVKTDASHFISTIHSHMIETQCYAHPASYDIIGMECFGVAAEHQEFTASFDPAEEPHLIFCSSYQDGLIHGLRRLHDHERKGDYASLHYVAHQIDQYQHTIDNYVKRRDYWNSFYFEGYKAALLFFHYVNLKLTGKLEEDEQLDLLPYYHPRYGMMSKEQYWEKVRGNPQCHKAALKQAMKIISRFPAGSDIVLQHTPFG